LFSFFPFWNKRWCSSLTWQPTEGSPISTTNWMHYKRSLPMIWLF
jgi:hypothetical protein